MFWSSQPVLTALMVGLGMGHMLRTFLKDHQCHVETGELAEREIMLCLDGKSNFIWVYGWLNHSNFRILFWTWFQAGITASAHTSGMWIHVNHSKRLLVDGKSMIGSSMGCFLFAPHGYQHRSLKAWTFLPLGDILVSPVERACNAFLLILGQLFVAKVGWFWGWNDGIWGGSRDCVTLF